MNEWMSDWLNDSVTACELQPSMVVFLFFEKENWRQGTNLWLLLQQESLKDIDQKRLNCNSKRGLVQVIWKYSTYID